MHLIFRFLLLFSMTCGAHADDAHQRTDRGDHALNLTGRIHLNVNTNDYKASRAFYRALGFAQAIGPFPETNTLEMAHSMGMAEPYRMYAEIIYLGEDVIDPTRLHEPTGRMIDLIQWYEPQNTAPAYGAMNRLGWRPRVLRPSGPLPIQRVVSDLPYCETRRARLSSCVRTAAEGMPKRTEATSRTLIISPSM